MDHNFLFRVLSHVGFGPSFMAWVKLLYSGISSIMCINGYMSDTFHPTRGVRQGYPLCTLLYILTIEVLAFSRAVPGLLLPGVPNPLPVVSLCADDTTVIALSDSAILEVYRVYALFEAGTGSKLNLSKCEGLWLGPWCFRTNPPPPPWTSSSLPISLRSLGSSLVMGTWAKLTGAPVLMPFAVVSMPGDPVLSPIQEKRWYSIC